MYQDVQSVPEGDISSFASLVNIRANHDCGGGIGRRLDEHKDDAVR